MREGSYDDSVGVGSCTGEKRIFYAKSNVSAFVNFEADHLKKMMMMKKSAF